MKLASSVYANEAQIHEIQEPCPVFVVLPSHQRRRLAPHEEGMKIEKSLRTLGDADLKGKKVFVRADLDVPLDNAQITDDTRIRASVPTIKFLIKKGAKVILASHLGCPKGVTPKFSLKPLVPRLFELLGVDVVMANDCIGAEVEKLAAVLPEGGVLLLENVRFYKGEVNNDLKFAKKLASVADLYVNDAFGTPHWPHASTKGVTKFLSPIVAGFFLMQKKKKIRLPNYSNILHSYLVEVVANSKKPFSAILGGSKVSSKIPVIALLLDMTLILPLPSRRAVLPLPVYAVYATKHPWEAPAGIHRQQTCCIFSSRLPQ
ncbi:hypothetical protein ZWY2020_034248, partial [Hordeum vulgare]